MQKEQKPPDTAKAPYRGMAQRSWGEGQGRDARITDQHIWALVLRVGFVFPKEGERERERDRA